MSDTRPVGAVLFGGVSNKLVNLVTYNRSQ